MLVNGQRDNYEIKKRQNASRDTMSKDRNDTLYPFSNTGNAEVFNLMPGEIALQNRDAGYKKRLYSDTDLRVFTSCNGMYVNKDHENGNNVMDKEESNRTRKRQKLEFAGVVFNQPENDGNIIDTVLQFGGTRTIVNTGNKPIRVGDKVIWDLPKNHKEHLERGQIAGIHNEKVLVQTLPYTSNTIPSVNNIKDKLKITNNSDMKKWSDNDRRDDDFTANLRKLILLSAAVGASMGDSKKNLEEHANDFGLVDGVGQSYSNDDDEWDGCQKEKVILKLVCGADSEHISTDPSIKVLQKNIVKDTMMSFMDVHNDVKRRVIGKAVSNADKGDEFDIVLGSYA